MNDSAAFNAGQSLGTIFGYVIVYGGILWLGYYFGNRLARQRDGVFVRWPVGVALVVVLLLMAGQCSSQSQAQPQSVSESGDIVVHQQNLGPVSGFSGEFPPSDLNGYNSGIRDGIMAALKERGVNLAPEDVSVSSETILIAGHKVIKSKTYLPTRIFQYGFMGVARGNATQVFCTSRTAQPFDPIGTECERQVNLIFAKAS